MSTVNGNQDAGYWRDKCEVYERLIPQLLESVMNMVGNQSRQCENPFASMLGNLINSPQYQEYLQGMKHIMDHERERFEREHNLGKPSI